MLQILALIVSAIFGVLFGFYALPGSPEWIATTILFLILLLPLPPPSPSVAEGSDFRVSFFNRLLVDGQYDSPGSLNAGSAASLGKKSIAKRLC